MRRSGWSAAIAIVTSLTAMDCAVGQMEPAQVEPGLTAVTGVVVGHHTLTERPTGCTVVLVPAGAVGGVDVRGGAPGTREIALLDPVNTVERVHAVVLAGGSAFGLDAAGGVMRFLEERNVGFQVGNVRVPIVVGAILFDLMVGEDPSVRPDAACGYMAAQMATAGPVVEGSVGAGAGASVGKSAGPGRAMRGGIGSAAVTLPDGLTVAALVAVNPVGDVIDPGTGTIVAGVRTEDGAGFADARQLIRSGVTIGYGPGQNTSIGVVATNATLTKSQSTKVAQMAQDGVARAVVPAHTPLDGDTMFALAVGGYEGDANVLTIGALAADVVTTAILRAVRAATGLEGIPAASELTPDGR